MDCPCLPPLALAVKCSWITPATETNRSRAPASRQHSERIRSTLAQLAVKCPSATARSTAGGTPGRFELDREPRMHVMEEQSKENSKMHQSQTITTEYGELHF